MELLLEVTTICATCARADSICTSVIKETLSQQTQYHERPNILFYGSVPEHGPQSQGTYSPGILTRQLLAVQNFQDGDECRACVERTVVAGRVPKSRLERLLWTSSERKYCIRSLRTIAPGIPGSTARRPHAFLLTAICLSNKKRGRHESSAMPASKSPSNHFQKALTRQGIAPQVQKI